ncbi:MAG: DNA-3-methyladenine glycosylase [Anaerolineae bacterium]|nr:DNA-3-methyladenine glycosylase [Anaerolineae bacterium]
MSRLTQTFFARDTLTTAHDLLGCLLVHEVDGQRVAGRIVEVEAYTGHDDLASHAARGKTPRNTVMFGPPGISYIYLIYGMYQLLNVIAKPEGVDYPAAILIRALEPVEGLQFMAARRTGRRRVEWTSGPGRLTLALAIDQSLNGIDMTAPGSPLYFEEEIDVPGEQVQTGPRIGINVSEPWQSMPWRFWLRDNPFVSRAG